MKSIHFGKVAVIASIALMALGSLDCDLAMAWGWRNGPAAPSDSQVDPLARKLAQFSQEHEYSAILEPYQAWYCEGKDRYEYDNYVRYLIGPLYFTSGYLGNDAGRGLCSNAAVSWGVPSLREKGVAGFDLSGVLPNGYTYNGILELESGALSQLMATRLPKLTTKYKVTLKSCDGKVMDSRSEARSLEELVEQFQGLDFKSYLRCTLSLDAPVIDNEPRTEYRELNYSNVLAAALRGGQLVMNFVTQNSARHQFQITFQPSSRQKDERRKEQALQAARDFIALIKSHGAEIIRASHPSLNDSERNMILNASLAAKKPEIIRALKRLNQDYSELELVEKFSASSSVREAYNYVKEIETRVGRIQDYSQKLNLGNVFNIQ